MKQSFQWGNSSFEVRAMLGIDRFLFYGLVYDVGKIVLAHYGYDIDKEYPKHLDLLISQFVTWASITEIEGDDLAHCRLTGGKPADVLAFYLSWEKLVTRHPDLWASWDSAYKSAQLEDDTEKKEAKDAIGVTS